MARARNIKPSFFDNDQLGELDPLARLLFIGMWTLSDYQGSLEWREKRVKAQLLPYDNCNIKELAINLDKSGFIRFYSDGSLMYVNIVNFGKHQNPHKNEREKGSDIPSYSESMRQVIDLKGLTINPDKNGTALDNNETDPADSLILIPDSPILNPDPPIPCSGHGQQVDLEDVIKNEKNKIPVCQHEKIIEIYHEVLPELPKTIVHLWGGARKKNLNARWKEYPQHQDLEFWRFYFGLVRQSSFHMGDNDRGWQADLEWLVKQTNFAKILGKYA